VSRGSSPPRVPAARVRPVALNAQTLDRLSRIAEHWEIDLLEAALPAAPDDFEVLVRLGELYSRVGRHLDGLAVDLKLVAMAPLDPMVHYNLACSLALTGQVEPAIGELRSAIRLGYDEVEHLMKDADLVAVRCHPGFPDLLRQLEARREPACE
jgi:tetratricopeptide (TPR) repeat protein